MLYPIFFLYRVCFPPRKRQRCRTKIAPYLSLLVDKRLQGAYSYEKHVSWLVWGITVLPFTFSVAKSTYSTSVHELHRLFFIVYCANKFKGKFQRDSS